MADNIIEFNQLVKDGELQYDDVTYSQQYGDNEVLDALWMAWDAVGVNITKIIYDGNSNFDDITKQNAPRGISGTQYGEFYNELFQRAQIYYTRKLDIQFTHQHGDEECLFTLNKGEKRTKCECGKDIGERLNRIQEILERL